MKRLEELIKKIKERIKYTKNLSLFEGILFAVIGLVSLFFDRSIGQITLLFIFPILIISIALELFFLADRYKELDTKRWILLLIEGFILLFGAVYFIFNPVEMAELFIKWIGVLIIFRSLMKLVILPNKLVEEYVLIILSFLLGLALILFTSTVLNTLYTIILIVFVVYGVFKIVWSLLLNKILKAM